MVRHGDLDATTAAVDTVADVTLLSFSLDGHRFAVFGQVVRELLRAASPTPLPRAPRGVLGVLDLRGSPVVVLDIRGRFGFAERALRLEDVLVVLEAGERVVAIAVDAVHGLIDVPSHVISPVSLGDRSPADTAGVAHLEDGSAVIYDLSRFFSTSEESELQAALVDAGAPA